VARKRLSAFVLVWSFGSLYNKVLRAIHAGLAMALEEQLCKREDELNRSKTIVLHTRMVTEV
jgi:hypothetical protein